jgi:hypothetical protein
MAVPFDGLMEEANFTHICGRSLRGRCLLFRRTRRDRKRANREVKEKLRRRMHNPIPSQGQWLRQVMTGPSSVARRRWIWKI